MGRPRIWAWLRSRASRRTRLTPATGVALLALVMATTGSAAAAKMITGANIKDSTLTGADVRNGNLGLVDFSVKARSSLLGAKGPKGETGQPGLKGDTGAQGPVGLAGNPAHVQSKWSWFDSRYLRTDGLNSGPDDWYAYGGVSPNGNIDMPNLQWTNSLDRSFETVLSLNSPNCNEGEVQGTDCAWGANDGGGVTVAWDSNITAVANISVMHSQDSDIAALVTPPHTRIQCYLSANRGTGSSDFDRIGAKADISGFRQRQVETLTLVGSINRTTSVSTDYMVRVECRDADGTNGRSRYYVLGGSMSVVATERG